MELERRAFDMRSCLEESIDLLAPRANEKKLDLAYEVMDGNTSEQKTLQPFLGRIESLYGKARRVWVMDRGIPTEATLKKIMKRTG